jgi:hypothetical protein
VKWPVILPPWVLCILLLASCHHQAAKSAKCFDDIRELVAGRTAAEVEGILGKPDSRQTMLLSAERWTWWNYTFLDGKDYPPEMRGRLVHLEIIFERSHNGKSPSQTALSELRAADPLSVTYMLAREAK